MLRSSSGCCQRPMATPSCSDVLVVFAVVIAYLYDGGRLSFALCILVLGITVNYDQSDIKTAIETATGSASSVGGKSDDGCNCKKGLPCKGKAGKAQSVTKKAPSSYPIAVDFTSAFSSEGKKALLAPKKSRKVFRKNFKTKSELIKSAMTVSNEKLLASQIYVMYSSLQGAALRAAELGIKKLKQLDGLKLEPVLKNLDEIGDLEEYFVECPSESAIYLIVLPSYESDSPIDYFLNTLEEYINDFRIDKFPLRKLTGYAVLGIGDSETWPEKFCYQAKIADLSLAKLGARRVFPVGEVCMKYGGDPKIEEWLDLFSSTLKDDEPILYEYDESVEDNDGAVEPEIDVEDIGGSSEANIGGEVKKMVDPNSPTYKNLVKQGYSIVGSHSGVKICRWTKNDLRGRGSCYKHSLFNIVSSRCMELTPSLACSSKCVFCWRHGTNPVSKDWRWQLDPPEFILETALEAHYSKIKQMRGVPGVIADRFANAFKVAHCALSLVGEPIMYPHINEFIGLLHSKGISSFLVCNAQHPEQLKNLVKVTQLYVSIDAPTKQELKKIDRPLHKDFWERMLECIHTLSTTQAHQRTVFRLTLVKGFNMAEVSAYATLVEKGKPCFIEVKGATFCGSSAGNGNPLTMQNIPFYEECTAFAKALTSELKQRGLNYDLAAEHAHSNTILVADTKFKQAGKWRTHIDFETFFKLLKSGKPFSHLDYTAETPEWALFGNGGFAPGNVRHYKKKNKIEAAS